MNTVLDLKKKVIKVIIVEDFKLTRVGLKCALNENSDIKVIYDADNASIGLAKINELSPDVVLMDIGLPDMNGLEAIAKLREMNNEIKVIALSSHSDNTEVLTALSCGANAYCLKEIEIERLANVIRDIVDGACWLDPFVANNVLQVLPRYTYNDYVMSKLNYQKYVPLTEREKEVLRLVVMGKSNTEIATEIIVSVHTAKAHVCSILQKLNVSDRVQAAVKAVREHLV